MAHEHSNLNVLRPVEWPVRGLAELEKAETVVATHGDARRGRGNAQDDAETTPVPTWNGP